MPVARQARSPGEVRATARRQTEAEVRREWRHLAEGGESSRRGVLPLRPRCSVSTS